MEEITALQSGFIVLGIIISFGLIGCILKVLVIDNLQKYLEKRIEEKKFICDVQFLLSTRPMIAGMVEDYKRCLNNNVPTNILSEVLEFMSKSSLYAVSGAASEIKREMTEVYHKTREENEKKVEKLKREYKKFDIEYEKLRKTKTIKDYLEAEFQLKVIEDKIEMIENIPTEGKV